MVKKILIILGILLIISPVALFLFKRSLPNKQEEITPIAPPSFSREKAINIVTAYLNQLQGVEITKVLNMEAISTISACLDPCFQVRISFKTKENGFGPDRWGGETERNAIFLIDEESIKRGILDNRWNLLTGKIFLPLDSQKGAGITEIEAKELIEKLAGQLPIIETSKSGEVTTDFESLLVLGGYRAKIAFTTQENNVREKHKLEIEMKEGKVTKLLLDGARNILQEAEDYPLGF